MKDITHYFSEPRKSIEKTPTPPKEVNLEPAKTDTNIKSSEKPTSKKRGRPKKKSDDKTDNNSSKVEDSEVKNKKSSPSDIQNKLTEDDDNTTTSKSSKTSRTSSKSSTRKSKRSKVDSKKDEQDQEVPTKLNGTIDQEFVESEKNTDKGNDTSKKQKHTEKLIEMADKKGYSKRKLEEEDEAVKIEKRLDKRKKLFTIDTNKIETNKTSDVSKNSTPVQKCSSRSLLNYFSKATPEQLEKEKINNSTVVVKADVHTPNGMVKNISVKSTKTMSDKKKKIDSQQILASCDEIQFIGSECVSPSAAKNEQPKSTPQRNKPRWSLKIKLQSNSEENFGNDSYSSKVQKENIKVSEKIPKILLPNTSHKEGSPRFRNKKEKPKTEENPKPRTRPFVCGIELSDSEEIEVVEEYPAKRKSNEKLAPLFTKKSKPNPEFVAARKLFLQSDLTEVDNRTQKPPPIVKHPTLFPRVSHVTQLEKITDDSEFRIAMKRTSVYNPSINVKDFKAITGIKDLLSNTTWESVKVDVEETLNEIETNCSDARTLWKFVSSVSKCTRPKTTPKSKSKRKSLEKRLMKQESFQDSLHCPWIHKYKPLTAGEIVGNEESALKLKNWLDGWKSSKVTNDSSDEFYSSDCSLSSSNENNQVAVLIGPHGTGKTASVYAVAEELGYRVLEVNASSKRPGKKILKDFEEATQSHRVKKLKLALTNEIKKKEELPKKISQNSLILIEDIDLLFDEDEGFVSATFQLASNTKRPIVMTTRDVCPHLPKIAPQQLRIHFQPATGKRVSALLQLISLAETGCKLPHNCTDMLSQNGDLRKALLQLQFLLQSSTTHSLPKSQKSPATVWSDVRPCIYKPTLKREKKKTNKNSCDVLEDLTDSLNRVTLLSSLCDAEDPTSPLRNSNLEPSLSLEEHLTPYSKSDTTSAQIAEWLSCRVLDEKHLADYKRHGQYTSQLHTKKCNITKVDSALAQVTSTTLDRRAMAVDYLPCIRTICRMEETRNQTNTKRGNRFFHYLQGTKLPNATLRSTSILTAACKVFQDDSETN